jgi:hypothetical protein
MKKVIEKERINEVDNKIKGFTAKNSKATIDSTSISFVIFPNRLFINTPFLNNHALCPAHGINIK